MPDPEKEEIKNPEKEETTLDTKTDEKAPEKADDLSGLLDEFVAELPEDMRGLIPDSLSAIEKIKLARGLAKTAGKKATPEDGPGSHTPGRKQAPNLEGMTANELLNMGLK